MCLSGMERDNFTLDMMVPAARIFIGERRTEGEMSEVCDRAI